MKSFEDILDNIDVLVSEGKLSEESASNIADSFYDRYVTEANAYNKAIDIYKKKGLASYNQGRAIKDIAKSTPDLDDKMRNVYIRTANKKFDKAEETAKKLGVNNSNRTGLSQDDVYKRTHQQGSYHGKLDDESKYWVNKENDGYRGIKKEWMANHGNTGKTPEERYKAGRYLKIHQMAKESSLEDEINGLGIACEAGLISEDFLPILLEAVDSYLD